MPTCIFYAVSSVLLWWNFGSDVHFTQKTLRETGSSHERMQNVSNNGAQNMFWQQCREVQQAHSHAELAP
jgi:hypothetical protein